MTYDYATGKRDISKIDKLNSLKDINTFWNDVMKLYKNVKNEHGIDNWEHLAEVRYNELLKSTEGQYIVCVKNADGEIIARACKIVHNGHIYPKYSLSEAEKKAKEYNADKLRMKMYRSGCYYAVEEVTENTNCYISIMK